MPAKTRPCPRCESTARRDPDYGDMWECNNCGIVWRVGVDLNAAMRKHAKAQAAAAQAKAQNRLADW